VPIICLFCTRRIPDSRMPRPTIVAPSRCDWGLRDLSLAHQSGDAFISQLEAKAGMAPSHWS
jgi:hypothetical protein